MAAASNQHQRNPKPKGPPAKPPPPPPKPTTPPPNTVAADAAADQTAHGIIATMMHEFGLDGLADWAWKRYKETGSIDLVKMEMEDRPEYKQRFAGRLALRDQGVQMTEAEQIAYEGQAHALMRQAGMPSQFYNSWQDFQGLIGAGISVAELGSRINDAYLKVAQAPPQIRSAMAEYYGAGSDAALAALVLDKNKAAPTIMQEVASAETGGYLAVQGINIQKSLAESLARAAGFSDNQIQQAASQVGSEAAQHVFDARFGEAGVTLDQGLQANFANNQQDVADIQHQQEQRAASTAGSSLGGGGFGTAQH